MTRMHHDLKEGKIRTTYMDREGHTHKYYTGDNHLSQISSISPPCNSVYNVYN